jgi:hypothetical protein
VTALVGRLRATREPLGVLAAFAASMLSILAGTLLVSKPNFALLPIAALVAALVMVDARARLAVVLFGGLFLLQTTGGLDGKKLAFLVGVGVAFVGAFLNVQTLRETAAYRLARPLFAASIILVALACVSVLVAHMNGIPPKSSLRDLAPYLLFASAPVFALDAQAAMKSTTLLRLLIAVGTLGAIAFAVQWLERRGIAYLAVSHIAVASLFVPAALFSYAMSSALQRSARRTQWLLLAACVFALLISTSTRATIALLLAPLAIAFGARQHRTGRSVRLLALGPLVLVLTVALAQGVILTTGANQDVLSRRLAIFRSSGDVEKDASYKDRLTQTGVAWSMFKTNTLYGSGAGTEFEWKPQGLPPRSSFILDTPVTFPAKFGLLGLVAAILVVGKYWSFTRALGRRAKPTVAQLALVGYLAVAAGLAILNNPLEDKGLSFGMILILALVLGEAEPGSRRGRERALAVDSR